jgi:hypothetical protein
MERVGQRDVPQINGDRSREAVQARRRRGFEVRTVLRCEVSGNYLRGGRWNRTPEDDESE